MGSIGSGGARRRRCFAGAAALSPGSHAGRRPRPPYLPQIATRGARAARRAAARDARRRSLSASSSPGATPRRTASSRLAASRYSPRRRAAAHQLCVAEGQIAMEGR